MERERKIITAILLLLLLLWLGFSFHRDPRFAGSAFGGLLGISATLFMLVPLAYSICKRFDPIKNSVTTRLPLTRLLSWHIYASLMGSALAILHSGHRFNSWLGILLTAFMLLSVLSGYVCRYFFIYVSREQKEHELVLVKSREAYALLGDTNGTSPIQIDVSSLAQIVEVMADSQYVVEVYDSLKRKLHLWLSVHIWLSVIFYLLLILHIVAGIQFGLRWFS
jgi:hypothetical protein